MSAPPALEVKWEASPGPGAGGPATAAAHPAAASPLEDTDALAEAIEAAGASADIEPGLSDLKAAAASGGKAKSKGKKR